jgi:hypothetical protein
VREVIASRRLSMELFSVLIGGESTEEEEAGVSDGRVLVLEPNRAAS